MQITLTPDLAERLRVYTSGTGKESEIEVIRRALDSLDAHEVEVAAIQEGIDSARAGNLRDFADFDREFRAKHGIPLAND